MALSGGLYPESVVKEPPFHRKALGIQPSALSLRDARVLFTELAFAFAVQIFALSKQMPSGWLPTL